MASLTQIRRRGRWSLILGTGVLVALLTLVGGALGASVNSAAFTGGTGTVTVGGTLYAKSGGALTLTVNTSSDTQCVQLTGAHTARQTSATPKSSWTFSLTAGPGNGVQTVTAAASPGFNQNNCTGQSQNPKVASYTLDNTGPVVTASVSPAANAAGWNNSNVSITWSATDAGSGVASGPTPATDGVTANTAGLTKTSSATDRLGNSGTGSVIVKLDKAAPSITGSRNPSANANGWNNDDVTVGFTCSDGDSGIKSCTGGETYSTTQLVTGTARDNADNTNTAAVDVKIDKVAPSLVGSPTTAPNAAGWYSGNVVIAWSPMDNFGGSGIDSSTVPGASTISSEGEGLTASASVEDLAGNQTTATSSPAVKIDKTAPNTSAFAPDATDWNNVNQTVTLDANDSLSGVSATHYKLDGGAPQTGTSVAIASEGVHTLEYWSVDRAGNSETHKTVEVKIDKTPPTINHSQTPPANLNGWNRTDVSVSFVCNDALSGIESCGPNAVVSAEGKDQQVLGTAVDNAGNSVTDPATVSIDKSPPTISAALDRAANGNGWFNADVIVSFTCGDALSGIDACSAPVTLGEGFVTATGSGTDAAGNSASTSAAAQVDKTAPLLAGAATTAPNGSGWYGGDVTVAWSCSDALSGVDGSCPANSIVTGEGGSLSASASVRDKAGNEATATAGVKIDRTAPATVASVPDPLASGWYAGAVLVTLDGVDPLSGVDKTYYSVDGGSVQLYGGPFSHALKGSHTITFWSVDKAGNVEDKTIPGHTLTLKIDDVNPTIAGMRAPAANTFGWNNGSVAVAFNCTDAESGIKDCLGSKVLEAEGANQSASGTARDSAGNESTALVDGINIDLTQPTLSGAPTVPANEHGWHKGDVTINWTAADALSGVDPATIPANSVIAGEGDSLGAGPVSVFDRAGNTASASVSGIKIDRRAPSSSHALDPAALGTGWHAGPVTVTLTASDQAGLSGVDKTHYRVDGGEQKTYAAPFIHALGGTHTIQFWSVDKAGNAEAAKSVTIKIDNVKPTINGSRSPAANGFGWNNGTVTASFTCSDAESGINKCQPDIPVPNEGANQSVTGAAEDNAGNVGEATVSGINIDKTAPTLTGAATTNPNAHGWYKDDVTIAWTGQDGLSGIDPASAPANSVISGEGSTLSATATIKDKAGNTGNGSASGIKIDRTPPSISGAPTPAPNGAGWNNGPVTVKFTCSDALSGVQECGSDFVLNSDGVGLSASRTATDRADNAASATVSGIKIDSKAPKSEADISCTSANGWCRGQLATVVLSAVDQAGLSGVSAIRYSVNGGAWQTANGASVSVNVPLAAKSGLATVQFRAVDVAGNEETINGVSLKYDNIAPTVTHSLDPVANAAGWNRSDVTVSFSAVDDSDGSGVDFSTLTPAQLLTNETAGQVVNGQAFDLAGNKGTDSATVRLDRTDPTISGAPTTSPNANGWYSGPVTVKWTCADALAGIAACPADDVVSTNGANQSVSGTAVDRAGNERSASVGGLNVDAVKPEITLNGVANGGIYTLGAVPAATCTASDGGSGLDGACAVAVTGGLANGVGTFSYTASAKDKAGNAETLSGQYRVIYAWSGFLQPINDTAHQIGASTSIFKAASTVPAKLQLKRADGSVVQANSLPAWLTPAKGSATTAAVDESLYAEPATSGSTYRWDSTAQQYIYNWGTAKNQAGNYWRIGVRLDDGQVYYVNIGLR